jgi:hypothetical protein
MFCVSGVFAIVIPAKAGLHVHRVNRAPSLSAVDYPESRMYDYVR